MNCSKWIPLTMLVGIVGSLQAEDKAPPPNYKHLTRMEPLIGTFVAKFPIQQDIPGVAKEGDAAHATLSRRWTLDKNAISGNAIIKVNSKTIGQGEWMIGWDAADKQIVLGSFNSQGAHERGVCTFEDDNCYIKGEGANGEGKKISATVVISDITEDSFAYQRVSIIVGGEKQPDGPKVTFNRVK